MSTLQATFSIPLCVHFHESKEKLRLVELEQI